MLREKGEPTIKESPSLDPILFEELKIAHGSHIFPIHPEEMLQRTDQIFNDRSLVHTERNSLTTWLDLTALTTKDGGSVLAIAQWNEAAGTRSRVKVLAISYTLGKRAGISIAESLPPEGKIQNKQAFNEEYLLQRLEKFQSMAPEPLKKDIATHVDRIRVKLAPHRRLTKANQPS